MKLEPLRVCCEVFRRRKYIIIKRIHNPNNVDTFGVSTNCSNYFKFTHMCIPKFLVIKIIMIMKK